MSALILHHYALSPFSEKMRRIFAFKGLAWHAVEQPLMAPKPDLTPLTGGYRRIPVLQIGADIYCDTALIARMVERRYPTPTCLPANMAGNIALLEDWADHRLFMQVVPPVLVELLPALPPEFLTDRAAMTTGFSRKAIEEGAPQALSQTRQSLDRLDLQLQASPYLLGEQFTLADASVYHCIWFLKNSPGLFAEVLARRGLADWFRRIEQVAGDQIQPLTSAEALAIAKAAQPEDVHAGCVPDRDLRAGRPTTITADDYGIETTTGELIQLTTDSITVVRTDQQVGQVAVHYPRAGYRISQT